MRAVSLVMLGVTLFIAGFVGNWAQDAAAPWINLGEAKTRGTVAFESDGGRYRVLTSGPARPGIASIGCSIAAADGTSRRELGGGGGVNAAERFGVTRVLEFKVPAGPTQVVCEDRRSESNTFGRFQVVAADGIVSKAILAAFALGGLLLVAGGLWLLLQFRRRDPAPVA